MADGLGGLVHVDDGPAPDAARLDVTGAGDADGAVGVAHAVGLHDEAGDLGLVEIESGEKLKAYDIYDADVVRTAWYHALRTFFERYDYWIMPSASVFPFDANTDWPKQVGGRTMDTYHRWMEVMIPVTMSSCPALGVPVGFNSAGLPMGMQIVAPNHRDFACLQLAYAYDQATQWVTKRPPPLLGA